MLERVDHSVHPVAILNWFMLPNPDLYLDEEEARPVSPRYYCESHSEDHDCDEPEMLLPVVNSPRMGMCAYTGPD